MGFEKVLIDTNICLDAILYRKPFANHALQMIEAAESGLYEGVIDAHSFDTIFYLLRRDYGKEKIYAVFAELRKALGIADVTRDVVDKALNLQWPDFEDAIQYQAAIAAGCQALITRNARDFKQDSLPVLSPDQFLEQL